MKGRKFQSCSYLASDGVATAQLPLSWYRVMVSVSHARRMVGTQCESTVPPVKLERYTGCRQRETEREMGVQLSSLRWSKQQDIALALPRSLFALQSTVFGSFLLRFDSVKSSNPLRIEIENDGRHKEWRSCEDTTNTSVTPTTRRGWRRWRHKSGMRGHTQNTPSSLPIFTSWCKLMIQKVGRNRPGCWVTRLTHTHTRGQEGTDCHKHR